MSNRDPHSVSIWFVRRNSFYFSYYSKYMNLLHNHFIADLRFVSIYLWQNKRIGENGPSLMKHIYKRFFSKIEELRNYVKKKNGHRNIAMNS